MNKLELLTVALMLFVLSACGDDDVPKVEDTTYLPSIIPSEFVDSVGNPNVIDNPYLPYIVGTVNTYEGLDEGDELRIVETVTDQVKMVMGVPCVVVNVMEYENGNLAEDTDDWYAQDAEGTVWYFGEDSKEIEGGNVVSTEGSWQAGVDGAQPGIIMMAEPMLFLTYKQEYLFGEAEDMGEIVGLNETVVVPFGTFNNCLKIKEFTPLEPGIIEFDYYAPGVGSIKEEVTIGGDELVELVSQTK